MNFHSGEISRLSSQRAAPEYFPAFDYLRIVLALVVVTGHAGLIHWENAGNYAVQIFFALSGWLISGILLRSKPSDLPKFYFHRAARIWIPYAVAIALLMAASLLKDRVTAKWVEIFFYDVTFVYNFFGPPQLFRVAMPLDGTGNHFWSICAEEQFYLLAPFLLLIPVVGKRLWFWCLLSGVVLASNYWNFFGSICLGVTASVAVKQFGEWQTAGVARVITATIAIGAFAAIVLDLAPYRLAAPISAVSIVLFFAQPGPANRFGAFVGGMSFPLYLNHWIGVFVAHAVFAKFGARDSLASGIASVFISLAIAAILYIAVDLNIKKYRNNFYSAARGKSVAVLGFVLVIIGCVVGVHLAT